MRRVTGTHTGTDTRCPHHCEKIQMSFKRELSVSLGLCVQSLYEYKRKDGACSRRRREQNSPAFKIVTSNQQYFISQTQSRRAE